MKLVSEIKLQCKNLEELTEYLNIFQKYLAKFVFKHKDFNYSLESFKEQEQLYLKVKVCRKN